MKLYTEEQIKKAIAYARKENVTTYENPTIERVLNSLTPIELPSDEDISTQASNRYYGTNFKHIYASGAKWMKEQILNQNK
jgi:hypothetical protein